MIDVRKIKNFKREVRDIYEEIEINGFVDYPNSTGRKFGYKKGYKEAFEKALKIIAEFVSEADDANWDKENRL